MAPDLNQKRHELMIRAAKAHAADRQLRRMGLRNTEVGKLARSIDKALAKIPTPRYRADAAWRAAPRNGRRK